MLILFTVVLLGALARKLHLMNDAFDALLSKLVMTVALPGMILNSVLGNTNLPDSNTILMLLVCSTVLYFFICLFAWVFVRVVYRGVPKPAQGAHAYLISFGNMGFIDSIPLWAVTLLGSLFIWVLSLVMILTVYSRFFKLYIATAIAPVPLASFAGQPSSSIGVAFLKSYAAICLEGCVIVLACVIFSAFASSPPAIADDTLAAATIVWNYVGELIFNMLVLVGAIKMSDRIIRELMGLG